MPEAADRPKQQPSAGLAEVIGRALTDEKFRNALAADPKAAANEYRLSQSDVEALESIPNETLEEHAAKFGSGSAQAMAIKVVVKGTF